MIRDLRTEIGQKQPFRSLEQEAFLNLIRTATLLSDHFDRLVKPAGITSAQYNVLRILRGAESEGLCRNELRDRLLTRMPDVTRLLDRMETAGLVSRTRENADRRLVRTRITHHGRQMLDDLEQSVAEEHARRFGHLEPQELQALIVLLNQVREST